MDFERRYLTDEQNKRVTVQLDIETFEKLERILEDYVRVVYAPPRLLSGFRNGILNLFRRRLREGVCRSPP